MKLLAAIIVDDRPLPELVPVINAHMNKLPSETDLFIFHGERNQYLTKFFDNTVFVPLVNPMNITEYNILLTSPEFWERLIGYQRVLVFQTDSMLLKSGIEEFIEMNYGYMGAPIWHTINAFNGGLSLRDPRLMYKICTKHAWDGTNEDMWICNILNREYPDRLAPKEVCAKFSVESIFMLETLGYHSPQSWLTMEQVNQIKTQYL